LSNSVGPASRVRGAVFSRAVDFRRAVIAGERTKLQVVHFKLSHSRAFVLRAYPQQTHESCSTLITTPSASSQACRGAASTTIYGRLLRKPICWGRQLECTNLSGLSRDYCAPLALMGVRCFWP
jgi:hypothetical protein